MNDQAQTNHREEQTEQQRALTVISALSEEYVTVYTIDVRSGEMKLYKISEQIQNAASGAASLTSYEDRVAYFLDHFVMEEDRGLIAEAADFDRLSTMTKTTIVQYRNPAGIWCEMKIVPTDKNVAVFGFASRDEQIRQEKERARELEEARAAAEAANDAKSTFLFNMSHDIRTPLNAILGFTELQGLYPENIGKAEEYRQKVLTASKQLLSILNDVLEMARIESRKLTIETELVDAREFADSIHAMFTNDVAKRGQTMTVDTQMEHPYLFLDKTHLTEILMNIISNSVKYTPEGGRIEIIARELPGSKPGEVIMETTVRDNGLGMSEDFLNQIFEQFSRERTVTDSGIHGTGLGMAIVKRLVDKMEGTIEITSKLGEGTQTTLRIPHRVGQEPGRTRGPISQANGSEIQLEGRRILLAEDLEVNALLAVEILQTRGITVERAEDGIQCVEMLEKAEAHYYDLILMDIQMPRMNGYDAAMKIRNMKDREKASIPIIAMTANAFEDDRRKAYLAGMNSHVAKPFQIEDLFANIQTTLKLRDYYIDSPALEEFKQKYEAMNCPCGYFVYLDDDTEQILYADSTTVDMFGCRNEDEFMELVRGSFKTLIHPDDLLKTEKEIAVQQAKSPNSLDYIDYRIIRKDEKVRKVKDIGYKVFNGDVYVYYVYIVDVTEI